MTTPPHSFWSFNAGLLITLGILVLFVNKSDAYGKWFTQALICFSTYCILTEIKRKK